MNLFSPSRLARRTVFFPVLAGKSSQSASFFFILRRPHRYVATHGAKHEAYSGQPHADGVRYALRTQRTFSTVPPSFDLFTRSESGIEQANAVSGCHTIPYHYCVQWHVEIGRDRWASKFPTKNRPVPRSRSLRVNDSSACGLIGPLS